MNIFKKIWCRTFQAGFRVAMPVLPYREPEIVESCAGLGAVFEKKNIKSVLIVTDKGIMSNGLVTPVEDVLKKSNVKYAIYDKTQPNPTVHNVEEALAIYKGNNCECLIAIGGGSSMDCAKAIGARVAYPKRSLGQMKGVMRILRSLPTVIAVPTTAGTGSEVTPVAIVTDSDNHYKYALMSFPLIPHYALLDAALTYSLPPHLTSTTGMDALTHAVEAYIGRSTSRETRNLATEAVRLVFENIENAYASGTNHEARKNMLFAAYKAGIAFSKSYVGYIHAIAHSLGGQYGTPHGLANAVILPYVLDIYGDAVYKKLHRLAVVAGVSSESDSPKAAAEKFISEIRRLNAEMGIPDKISGIQKEDIPVMAGHAEKEANPLYPVPVLMTKNEIAQIYYKIADWSKEND